VYHFSLVFHFSGSASFSEHFLIGRRLVCWLHGLNSFDIYSPAVALATRTRQLVTACTHMVVNGASPLGCSVSRLCYRLCRERGVVVLVVVVVVA